jgi:uncharacterized membrane protein
MNSKLESELNDSKSRNQSNWKGFIYVNKEDQRLIVPKRIPTMGWTLNFANPYSYVILLAIIMIPIIITILF